MSDQTEKPHPQRIGKYEILGELGKGGMGRVFLARDTRIGRDVAIKKLTEGYADDPGMLKRFYQEAGHTGNLHHPNIVTIYDFGDEDGQPYIVMQYVEGTTLGQLIRSNTSLHISEKLNIIEQVCSALAYAHSRGIIHRDVKPGNIIVQKDGLVKLLDFGIARANDRFTEGNVTLTGTMVGTPEYMAPERFQLNSAVDGRSDIFSAGIVLYEILTGVRPFPGQYPEVVHQILHQAAPPLRQFLTSYPVQLDQVFDQALAKEPQDRYISAADFGADLSAICLQLKKERATELLKEASMAAERLDLSEAKLLIRQALRFDSQNTAAKEMLQQVNQQIGTQEKRRRIGELVSVAKEAISTQNWNQAESACSEGLQLDTGNLELTSLLSEAESGRQKSAEIQRLLCEVEAERNLGNYSLASEKAKRALEIAPSDSRVLSLCKELDRELEEERRKTKVQKLLQRVREHLAAGKLSEAARFLAKAESLAPSDPDLLALKDQLKEVVQQEEKTSLVASLEEIIAGPITLEQLHGITAQLTEALAAYPAEPALLRLKLQLEPRLRDQQVRSLVRELTDAYKRLPPQEMLPKVREALRQFHGNSDLLKLESVILERIAREDRERTLADYLSKARTLLEDHLYLETVKVLDRCKQDGFSSPEIAELLELAKSRAAARMSQELVERSFLDAKQFLVEQNYEAVLELLAPVLAKTEEPLLRCLLDEATRNQKVLEKRISEVAAEVESLAELGLYDAAVGLILEESAGIRNANRVQTAFDLCTAALALEKEALHSIGSVCATLGEPDCTVAVQQLSTLRPELAPPSGVLEIERRLRNRVQMTADRKVLEVLEASKRAIASDDANLAESILESSSGWQRGCSATLQTECKNLQTEILAAKKVLRFRRASRH